MPWIGTVQWICESPYRPCYKRKNWFIGINTLSSSSEENTSVRPEHIVWKTVKASGPGGQHVNTTDSAVQATHRLSGIRVTSSEGRSQYANKKRAIEKINAILWSRAEEKQRKEAQKRWKTHSELERGNPVKIFVGKEFKQR